MRDTVQSIDVLLTQRNIKKAEVIIAKLLRTEQSEQQQARLLIRRARARLLNGRPEGAIHDLREVELLAPSEIKQPESQELLADCYFARFELSSVGFTDRNDALHAQEIYQSIRDACPDYLNLGWILYQLGRVYLTDNRIADADRITDAVACFQQALLAPSNVAALTAYCYERLGFVAFYEERDLNRSLGFLNKAVDTYPMTDNHAWLVQVYLLRSRVLCEMNQRDVALLSVRKAVKLASHGGSEMRPVLAETLFASAEVLTGVHGYEHEVIRNLEQFRMISRRPVGLDVTWARLHEMLGDAYLDSGLYAEAVSAYLAVLQFNPHYPWEVSIYYRIGRAYYFSGNYERAIDAVQHALKAADGNEGLIDYHLYDMFGSAKFALGRYDEAAAAYEAALKMTHANSPGSSMDKIRQYYEMSLSLANQ